MANEIRCECSYNTLICKVKVGTAEATYSTNFKKENYDYSCLIETFCRNCRKKIILTIK